MKKISRRNILKFEILKYSYQLNLIRKFITEIFPKVDREITRWIKEVKEFESDELARQAMASIRMKKFHCQGGGIYSLYPGVNMDKMIELIVALQTISDYLDNLCDRTEIKEEKAFRQLHLAFTDALKVEGELSDYYLHYSIKGDGGYLIKLVLTCRGCIEELPSYGLVQDHVLKLGKLYSELQIFKHLSIDEREKKVVDWTLPYLVQYKEVSSWEFAAATGSTLAVFILFAIASDGKSTEKNVSDILEVYFPWVCGLHILLDYFIDLKEDLEWGDLNFVNYYSSLEEGEERMKLFINNAMKGIAKLPNNNFHLLVIQGLLALYLSDPKVASGAEADISRNLVRRGGNMANMMWKMCKHLRKKNII